LVTQSLGNLTPEEREAAAKPTAAGDYWREWDAFRAAQRLFADEIDEIDKNSRNKKDKKDLGKRTIAVRAWFSNLPESQMEEAKAAAKWNSKGALDKAKTQM
jgi:hypothetical protein